MPNTCAAGDTDGERLIPGGDRPPVRRCETLEIALARGREVAGRGGHEPSASTVPAPQTDAGNRGIAQFQPPRGGAAETDRDVGAGREHGVQAERLARPIGGAKRVVLGGTRPRGADDRVHPSRAPCRAPLEDRDLVGAGERAQTRPGARERGRRVHDAPGLSREVSQRVDEERGREDGRPAPVPLLGMERLPADDGDPSAGADSDLAQGVLERRPTASVDSHQAECRAQDDVDVDRHDRDVADVLLAEHERPRGRADDEQRLLEPGVQVAQEDEVRGVLAIAVDDDPVGFDRALQRGDPRLELGARDRGQLLRQLERRRRDVGQLDRPLHQVLRPLDSPGHAELSSARVTW